MDEQRLIDLEIKISHHEAVLETLQELVYEQHKTIERLEARLGEFAKQFDGALEIGPGNDKPPHY